MSVWAVEINLKKPIKTKNGEEITLMRFREPKAKDMRKLKVDQSGDVEFGVMLDIAGSIYEGAPQMIDELALVDMKQVVTAVGELLDDGEETGETV